MARRIFHNLRGRVPFWLCLVVSIGMEVAGLIMPPAGVIDSSVLKGVGLLLAFPTLWCVYLAIDKGIDAKMTVGKTSIELTNPDDKENNSSEK
ncbi:MAG: hypothetical protein MJZ90_07645 [Bacteroidales bacterium]|nr:hypothetical protein [Bacteroidales bacterium]